MRRIAIINQKGGVGKTTTTANLGAAVARAGYRVLLVDLDPQGHLSLHFGCELRDEDKSVYDVLVSHAPIHDVLRPVTENVTLVPADIDLAGAEAELVSVMGREVILREALEPFEDQFDVMLIDCPPSLGVLTINALVATEEVVIPLQAQFFALQGLSKLLDTVTLVRKRINPRVRVSGIVLCMHEATTRLAGEIVEDLKGFVQQGRGSATPWANAQLFEGCIRRNIRLAEASSFGQSIFDYAPRSNGALDYATLTAEMFPEFKVDVEALTTPRENPAVRDNGAVEQVVAEGDGVSPTESHEGFADRRDASVLTAGGPAALPAGETVPNQAAAGGPPFADSIVPCDRRLESLPIYGATPFSPMSGATPQRIPPAPASRPNERRAPSERMEDNEPLPSPARLQESQRVNGFRAEDVITRRDL